MKSKTKRILRGASLFLVAGILGFYFSDIPRPELKYTYRDLQVPEEVAASYDTLMRYRKDGPNQIDIDLGGLNWRTFNTWTNLLPYAETIDSAWDNCTEGRQYIADLDRFTYITDWPFTGEKPPYNLIERPIVSFQSVRKLSTLYALHALLQAQRGNTDEGLRELAQHYSVTKKGLPYSTFMTTRMIFTALAKKDLRVLGMIIHKTDCTTEQLVFMRDHFPPLTANDVSFFRPSLGEYALEQLEVEGVKSMMESPLEKILIPFVFKPNHTLYLMKETVEPTLAMMDGDAGYDETRAALYLRQDLCGKLQAKPPTVWNFLGRDWATAVAPSFQSAHKTSMQALVESDLLALEIRNRLGETLEIKDPYTGADYRFDELTQTFYCGGPDGFGGTKDDIYIEDPGLNNALSRRRSN